MRPIPKSSLCCFLHLFTSTPTLLTAPTSTAYKLNQLRLMKYYRYYTSLIMVSRT